MQFVANLCGKMALCILINIRQEFKQIHAQLLSHLTLGTHGL